MKRTIPILMLALLPLQAALASSTLRCGSKLISLDDSSSEVLSKCGEPLSQDFLGYRERLDDYGFRQEVRVDEWAYGPRNGMFYYLRFEGNRLIKIDSKRGN